MKRKNILILIVLVLCCSTAVSLHAECKFYRYSDNHQLFYTKDRAIYHNGSKIYYLTDDGYICRYSDNKKIYYQKDDYIYRCTDNNRCFYIKGSYLYRYSDNKALYKFDGNRIYRESDGKQICYFEGYEYKILIFMMLSLTDF